MTQVHGEAEDGDNARDAQGKDLVALNDEGARKAAELIQVSSLP